MYNIIETKGLILHLPIILTLLVALSDQKAISHVAPSCPHWLHVLGVVAWILGLNHPIPLIALQLSQVALTIPMLTEEF